VRRQGIGKAVVVAVLTSMSLGVVFGVVLVLFGQVYSAAGREAPMSQSLLATLLFVSAITVRLGVVGGALAGIFLRRQRVPASVLVWVVRGIGMGNIVGALGVAAVPIVLAGASSSGAAGPILAMFSMFGAAGALTGAVVAVWCCRTAAELGARSSLGPM
jgi:hypothetical protein